MLIALIATALATVLAQGYGGGGSSGGGTGGGSYGGGGISYGPGFWAIAAVVVVAILVLGFWLDRRYRSRRSTSTQADAGPDSIDRAA